jgi:hypothetical protein
LEKYIQKLLIILFPFYPIWGAFFSTFTHQKIDSFINFLWIPIVIYYLLTKANRLPKYLLFLILFTIFHLVSIYLNNLATANSSFLFTILFDSNVLACAVLFIIENTTFDDRFISIMNRNILIIVAVSLCVSLIQVKIPSFFASPELTDTEENLVYLEQGRAFSIYSWININSLGITFPLLISILLNVYDIKKKSFSLIVISGLIVSFLSRARYIMISAIIVFSQLFISSKISLRNKIVSVFVMAVSIIGLLTVADNSGFSIQKVIDERILEKEGEMGSANARITSYYVFLMKFPENPWFGVGPATREDVVELLGGEAPLIHVGYLSYLYFYGAMGFFILFLSMIFLLRDAFIVGKKYLFWGSFYGLIAYYLANTTTVYFNFSEMGIILAVLYLKYYKDQSDLALSDSNSLVLVD